MIERELENNLDVNGWDRDGVPFHTQHTPIDQLDNLFRASLEEIWQMKA